VLRTRIDVDRRPAGCVPPFSVIHPLRNSVRALLLAVLAALMLIVAGTAAAASAKNKHPTPCWKTLINDWYDGRIDGTYPIRCYREALRHLPTDVDTYSSARDDIKQALQKRITQGHKGGGQSAGQSGGQSGGGTGGGSSSPGGGSAGNGGGGKTGGGDGSNSSSSKTGGASNSKNGPFSSAIKGIGPSHADSVPVPLIVLGAVALLLMAAGGAGFLARRMRTRKLQLASAASLPNASPEPRRPGR
jgi:hypothetical protein